MPALLAFLLLTASATAHQQLLFARVASVPEVPRPGEPFEVRVIVNDASRRAVSDMNLRLFFSPLGQDVQGANQAPDQEIDRPVTVALTGSGAGTYRGTVEGLDAGSYRMTLAEFVDGNRESSAVTEISVDGGTPLEAELLLPPGGGGGLGTWLVWLVGLPVLAGVLVTLLVLTGRQRPTPG
jgi:hypothetical protein